MKAAIVSVQLVLGIILAGCAASGGSKPQAVNLPPPPACMAREPVPEIRAGDDARLALARSRAALASANGRLDCSRKWYQGVRRNYSR